MSDAAASSSDIAQLADLLRVARHALAFTGAGISTESGIPDFRSPGGVWSKQSPVMYDDFLRDVEERRRYWRMRRESVAQFIAARPNAGHRALARLEALGRLVGVVTQNIDELHQRGGSRRVLEVHGTAMRISCLSCDKTWTAEEMQPRLDAGDVDFECDDCGGLLKSRTVSFGQALPADVWMAAMQLARKSDVLLAIGSSLVVYPAAELPQTAKRHGAKLVIMNRDETPLDDMADLVIRAGIGDTMTAVMRALES